MARPREEERNGETERGRMKWRDRERKNGTAREKERKTKARRKTRKKTLKEGDTNAVVSGNHVRMWDMNAVTTNNRVRILLQNNLKIILQIPTWLFPELRWYLPSVFNFKIFVPYHRGSCVNYAGILVLNFKNVTALFLIVVPS